MELIEKVKEMSQFIGLSDNKQEYCMCDGIVEFHFIGDPDLEIIIEKLHNLTNFLTQELKSGNIETFLDRDFETDVWFTL